GGEWGGGTSRRSVPRDSYEPGGIRGELFEIATSRRAKGRHDLVLGGRVRRPGDEHHRLPSAADDLLLDPLEVLAGLRRRRKDIRGVLHQDRTGPLKAPPRLDPR